MLEINLKNRAISQTTQNFNSMCRFGDAYLGATASGLYQLGGYSDHGVQIQALIKSGDMDFGTHALKRPRFFYFGIRSTGDVKLLIFCDGNLVTEYNVGSTGGDIKEVRVPVGRGANGRYWAWGVENVNGAFVALYSVKAIMIFMHPGQGYAS